jgi:DNA-binding NtrC family response regulator
MLHAMLERADCIVTDDQPDVSVHDNFDEAVHASETVPTLVVTPFSDAPRAVQAMARGVYGYILLPFQPEEAVLMVNRAAPAGHTQTPFEPRPLAEVEGEHIMAVLRHCNGNRSKAAQLLGIGRNTLWRKLAAMENSTARPNDENQEQ